MGTVRIRDPGWEKSDPGSATLGDTTPPLARINVKTIVGFINIPLADFLIDKIAPYYYFGTNTVEWPRIYLFCVT
jgi:hypothetical protein